MIELESPPQLQARNLRVWLVHLDREDCLPGGCQRLLSPDELQRAERFAVEPARRRFIVSRGALRTILSQYTRSEPAELRFKYSPKGKPSLVSADRTDVQFNLSHSGDLALIAVASGRQVGADLELIQDRPDLTDIARAWWAPSEQDLLRRVAPTQRCRMFYRIWTRKEAVLKASGQGITDGLDAPDVSHGLVGDPPAGELSVELGGSRWLVCDLAPAPNYAAALAVEAELLFSRTGQA